MPPPTVDDLDAGALEGPNSAAAPLALEDRLAEGPAVKRKRLTKNPEYWSCKAARQRRRRSLLASLTHRTRCDMRDRWVNAFIQAHPAELAGLTFREKVRRVQGQYWTSFSEDLRTPWYLHCLDPGNHARPDLSGHDEGPGQAGSAPGLPEAIPVEDQALPKDTSHPDDVLGEVAQPRHMGYLLSWQGSWGCDEPEVRELASLGLTGAALVQAVKRSAFFQWLWEQFRSFGAQRAKERHWPKYSGKCEVTLRAKDPRRNLVHFHLMVSDMNTRRTLTDQAHWAFLGFKPDIRPTGGRGRYLYKAVCNGHYYAQSPKVGSIYVFTNYPCFTECPVEQAYVFGLWKRCKMEDDVARQEIIRARGRGTRGFLQEIEFNRRWRMAQMDKAERMFVEWSAPLKPSKVFKVVVDWMKMFISGYGRATRFPFLVLNGDSRLGKTRYAVQLWGRERTLVLSCQNVLQPNLKGFSRDIKCIVYDEASHAMVVANKQVFQAGLDEVMLGQSACNEHVYSAWLYAVPMVVSTNNWLLGATPEEVAWLEKNSIVVNVEEPMWCEESLLALTDGPED